MLKAIKRIKQSFHEDAFYRYRLNADDLSILAEERHQTYKNADPFPHTIIDHLFPDYILDALLEEFPRNEDQMAHCPRCERCEEGL